MEHPHNGEKKGTAKCSKWTNSKTTFWIFAEN